MPTVAIQCPQCECYPLTCPGDPVGCVNFKNRPVIAMLKENKTGLAKDQAHYQQAELQPIEVIQSTSTREELKGHLRNTILKYLLRAKHKESELKDYEKALQYCTWLVQVEKGEMINPREGQ